MTSIRVLLSRRSIVGNPRTGVADSTAWQERYCAFHGVVGAPSPFSFDAIKDRGDRQLMVPGGSSDGDRRRCRSLMDVVGRPVLAPEGLPQLVQEFAVESVQRVLRIGLGHAVVEGRGRGLSRRADETGRGTRGTGQAGPSGLRGARSGTAARTAWVDVVVVLDDGHHESHFLAESK